MLDGLFFFEKQMIKASILLVISYGGFIVIVSFDSIKDSVFVGKDAILRRERFIFVLVMKINDVY